MSASKIISKSDKRMYFVAFCIIILAISIVIKLTKIQWIDGENYRELAKKSTVKSFIVPANRGSIFSSDGSLLAVSLPVYSVRFDALAPSSEVFNNNISALSDSLSSLFNKRSYYFENKLKLARKNRNRFLLIGKNMTYSEYSRLRNFPILNLGTYKGGRIDSIQEVRKHPVDNLAYRTIGYIGFDKNGNKNAVGIEGAFENYLNGKEGKVVKQKIGKGQYKPIRDNNQIEPVDGYDIISTIDVYIQDIAHYALLESLEKFQAEHGCVVVMETKTGHVKAIANLGRTDKDAIYKERLNYAIREKSEPGSTFKLVDIIALLEDNKVDTSKVYNRNGGSITYFGKNVVDSHREGQQVMSLAKGFEISSNTILVQAVYNNYKNHPKQFVNRINNLGLNKPLGLSIKGEGIPYIPQPNTSNWNKLTLPWMAFGYGVEVTPMQTLTLYNAVANDGVMVKPQFVSEIKQGNKTIKKIEKEIINPKICSKNTINKVKVLLENVVKRGTAKTMYTKNFSMAGKTGTAQANYGSNGGANKHYISSFVGFFPVENPKYSCIVVIHKPNTINGNYYGADVAGPVFKKIAQKIFTDNPQENKIRSFNQANKKTESSFNNYTIKLSKAEHIPNVKGMSAMDAIPLLENLGLKVILKGNIIGKVKSQSILAGSPIIKNKTIELLLE
jgi:cell division protein FtsI (penicillin-binding protein 3)